MLRLLALILIFTAPGLAYASGEDFAPSPHELAVQAQAKFLCRSTDEYKKTLTFLRGTKVVIYPEQTARLIAEKVSHGCDGAAHRFSKILILLKTIGLSDRKALAMALDFASKTPDVQKNFLTIFTHSFLSEFFDYDYARAAKLAYELSKDYQGDPAQERDDFVDLAEFCKNKKSLDLPNTLCAELAVKLARLSEYFPDGIRAPFHKIYETLRNDPRFGLDMRTAIETTYNILKSGPRAPENFLSAFDFALSKSGLDLDKQKSLQFGLKMADRSFLGDGPPAIPATTQDDAPDANRAAHF